MAGKIYVAKTTGVVNVDGRDYQIHKGITRVREGHALLKGREEIFEEIDLSVHYEVEQATKAPGEKRGAATSKSASSDPRNPK